jgi:peptidyl-prolyl cis-trans isomerase C
MNLVKALVIVLPTICLAAVPPADQKSGSSATQPAAASAAQAPDAAPAPAAATAAAPKPEDIVLSIGAEKITAAEFEGYLAALPEQVQRMARGTGKRQFAEQLVRMKLLAQEAERRKLDERPDVQKQLQLQRDNLLAGLVFNALAEEAPMEESNLRAYYEEHRSEYESAQARHILVKMKGSPMPPKEGKPELSDEEALAKAQELRKRILGGEDFAAVAEAESDDTGSGANGGDLGRFGRGKMVPEFEDAVFTKPVGEVSEPVKTQFGYHLIQVQERASKSFEEVRPEIEQRMRPEMARSKLESLREQAAVTFDDRYFAAAPEPAGAEHKHQE